MESRTSRGCWTCRLRRKRCDERPLQCSACSRLELVCDGYGSKPGWMNGGEQEREQRDQIKALIKENSARKRQRYNSGTQSSTADTQSEARTARPDKARESLDSITNNSLVGKLIGLELAKDESQACCIEFKIPRPVYLAQSETHSMMLSLDEEWLSKSTKAHIATSPLTRSGMGRSSNVGDFEEQIVPSFDLLDHHVPLIMHYLDNVFHLQFPFYRQDIHSGGRSWLLLLLRDSPPLCWVVLSLSAYHQHMLKHDDQGTIAADTESDQWRSYHLLALQEFRVRVKYLHNTDEMDTPEHLKMSIEILACIVQFISFELLGRETSDWLVHLQAASNLLSTIAKHCETLHNPSPPYQSRFTLEGSAMEELNGGEHKHLTPSVHSALVFHTSMIIWMDTLSSASLRTKSFLSGDIEDTLKSCEIEMDTYFGCKNWAVVLIRKVAELDVWKKKSVDAKQLSLKELVKRATTIEQLLLEGLADNKADLDPDYVPSYSSLTSGVAHAFLVATITEIFSSAALTYLHVIISGAFPKLLEIQSSVARTMQAFQGLPYPQLIQNTVWPLTITGCLALEEHQDYFKSLVSLAEVNENTPGNCWKGLQVMEKCWRLRRDDCEQGSSDWTAAMDALGYRIPLA